LHELLILFVFSFSMSILLWYQGSILAGAISAFSWFLTSQFWIYDNQGISGIGLFWTGLGVVNLILTFYAAWIKLVDRREKMRTL